MNHSLQALALLSALVLTGPHVAAQTFRGHYDLVGKPNVTMLIVPIPGTIHHLAFVMVGGQTVEHETSVYTPLADGTYHWMNQAGNEGITEQRDDGTLDDEVHTGPNAGKKTTWTRRPDTPDDGAADPVIPRTLAWSSAVRGLS